MANVDTKGTLSIMTRHQTQSTQASKTGGRPNRGEGYGTKRTIKRKALR